MEPYWEQDKQKIVDHKKLTFSSWNLWNHDHHTAKYIELIYYPVKLLAEADTSGWSTPSFDLTKNS